MVIRKAAGAIPAAFVLYFTVMNSVDITASIPLSDIEKDHLRQMFRMRLRIFCAGYAFITGFILKTLLPYAKGTQLDLNKPAGKPGDYELLGHLVTRESMFYILLTVFGGFALTTGVILFVKRIYYLRKDLKYGRKEPIVFTTTNKLFFEHTGQYFVSLDSPDYLHHEIDEAFFHKCNIGDKVTLYRTKFSKIIF